MKWSINIHATNYNEVKLNPTLSTAKKGAEQLTSFQPDCIIAIGGGSQWMQQNNVGYVRISRSRFHGFSYEIHGYKKESIYIP